MPVEIPHVIRKAVHGLDQMYGWEIIEYFTDHEQVTYKELRKMYKNHRQLNKTLRQMSYGALIERYEILGNSNSEAFYKISPYGKAFVNSLLSSLMPEK